MTDNNNNNTSLNMTDTSASPTVAISRQSDSATSSNLSKPFDIDSLIPKELRDAVDNRDNPQQSSKAQSTKAQSIKAQSTPIDDTLNQIFSDNRQDTTSDYNESESDYDSDSDTDVELVDEIDSIVKKTLNIEDDSDDEEQEEYFWKENPTYKTITDTLKYSGMDSAKIDEFLTDIRDKSVLENARYIERIEKERDELKTEIEKNTYDFDRLRSIERAAYFDSLPETKETFVKPMQSDIQEIKKILDYDGSGVSVQEVLLSNNRQELTRLLSGTSLTDSEHDSLSAHWRSYKETQQSYNMAKQRSEQVAKQGLSTAIPEKDIDTILHSSLNEFIKDPDHKYIKDAIFSDSGISSSEEASKVIMNAKTTFKNILKSLSNPKDFAHNTEWLKALAAHELKASHTALVETKYNDLQNRFNSAQDNLKKLASAYQKLRDSAKGITNSGNRPMYINGKSTKKTEDSQKFHDFLKGKIKLEDLF